MRKRLRKKKWKMFLETKQAVIVKGCSVGFSTLLLSRQCLLLLSIEHTDRLMTEAVVEKIDIPLEISC